MLILHASRFSAQSLSVPSSRPACSPRARRVVPEGPTRGGGAGRARRVVKRDLSAQPHSIPARGGSDSDVFRMVGTSVQFTAVLGPKAPGSDWV